MFLVPDTTKISHSKISVNATSNSKEENENSVPHSMCSSKDEEIFYREGQFNNKLVEVVIIEKKKTLVNYINFE